jgi:hypothetical protein
MLVASRITLSLVFPAPELARKVVNSSDANNAGTNVSAPFSGDINFADFVRETGGQLYYNRNDIGTEIDQARELGAQFYTLTYRPHVSATDGQFRRVRVSMRDPNLRAITKTGYFAPDTALAANAKQVSINRAAEAVRGSIPMNGVELILFRLVQLQDSRAVVITLQVPTKSLDWRPGEDGKLRAGLTLAAASKSNDNLVLASKMEQISITAESEDPTQLDKGIARLSIQVQVPRRTRDVRVALEVAGRGSVGVVDITRKVIDASPVGTLHKAEAHPDRHQSDVARP